MKSKKSFMKIKFTILFFFICISSFSQLGWQQISNFGSNPGSLKMFLYIPYGITANAPVVAVLHGCTQTAIQCRDNTGWNELADKYRFYVIYPEQQTINNSSNCFNWFLPGDQERDAGEALSIKQMVSYVQTNYTVDNTKIFTTGLSAGAGMSAVMLACYPDVFSGGAIMSGAPYKSATDAITASNVMYGLVNKTPTQWMNLVIGAFPGYNGVDPRVVIFHGMSDNIVSPLNVNESIEQWTAIHGVSQTAFAINQSFLGNQDVEQAVYKNQNEDTVVLTYKISNMLHAIAIDPGIGPTQGGTTGTYAVDKNFFSSYWAAKFFRITGVSTTTETILSDNPFTIYPNPANDYFTVNCKNNIDIEWIKIFDIQGKNILSTTNKNVDISSLSKGFYLTEIQYNKSKKIRKIISKQ